MPGARIHSMDALRASTMFLLVPVHAAILLAVNGHGGAWATSIYWVAHVFRLPLFFAMSGFFLALLLSRKGLRQTTRNRTVRIAVPLALGMVTLLPLTVLASRAAGVALSPGEEPSLLALYPGFLWFLWYLLIVDAIAIAAYLFAPGLLRAVVRCTRALVSRPSGGIVLLAILTLMALWSSEDWTVEPPGNTFVPIPAVLLYYILFFALGATLCAHRDLVDAAARNAWRWTCCALLAVAPAAALYSLHNSSLGARPLVHGAALLFYALATWTSLIALVGLADRYLSRPRPALRYLADASYWIYLSHLPAMVLVAGLLAATALATGPQFVLVTAASLAFSLLTYPLFVRYTAVGRLLNGPRTRPPGAIRLRIGPRGRFRLSRAPSRAG